MKNALFIILWMFVGWSVQGQQQGFEVKNLENEQLELKDFLSQGYPVCGYIYHRFDVLQKEAKVKEKKQRTATQLPVVVETKGPAFKIFELRAENEHWYSTQDIYSSLVAKVPSLRISNTGLNQAPRISIRGDANTIVIVDGVRYDASILNSLHPQDIESIKVSADPAAATYFIANQN